MSEGVPEYAVPRKRVSEAFSEDVVLRERLSWGIPGERCPLEEDFRWFPKDVLFQRDYSDWPRHGALRRGFGRPACVGHYLAGLEKIWPRDPHPYSFFTSRLFSSIFHSLPYPLLVLSRYLSLALSYLFLTLSASVSRGSRKVKCRLLVPHIIIFVSSIELHETRREMDSIAMERMRRLASQILPGTLAPSPCRGDGIAHHIIGGPNPVVSQFRILEIPDEKAFMAAAEQGAKIAKVQKFHWNWYTVTGVDCLAKGWFWPVLPASGKVAGVRGVGITRGGRLTPAVGGYQLLQ